MLSSGYQCLFSGIWKPPCEEPCILNAIFLAVIDSYYRDKKKFSEGKIKQWTTLSTVLVA